jgi:nicotinamidase/pyrazinamidase
MKTVFLDIDTQIDFLFPAGALYVPGAERLLPALAGLNCYAAEHGITVVSTMDTHSEDDPEFKDWPPHCVIGTQGQQKPAALRAHQIIVEKHKIDIFSDSDLWGVLNSLNADRYVVYGVVTEYCIASALAGLRKTGKPIDLVTDAIQSIDEAAAARMLAEFTAAGGNSVAGYELPKYR